MRLALATACLLLASPVAAQEPAFDGKLVDACLSAQAGEAGRPESCIGAAAGPCMASDSGGTTVGMGYCLSEELGLWDARLNEAYAGVLAEAKATDAEMETLGSAAPKQVPFLQDMQRKWIAFRDAACSYEGSRWGGGTGAGPAGVQCALTLTGRQALWLTDYLRAEP